MLKYLNLLNWIRWLSFSISPLLKVLTYSLFCNHIKPYHTIPYHSPYVNERVDVVKFIDGPPDAKGKMAKLPVKTALCSEKCFESVWYGMVWYGMVWYGIVLTKQLFITSSPWLPILTDPLSHSHVGPSVLSSCAWCRGWGPRQANINIKDVTHLTLGNKYESIANYRVFLLHTKHFKVFSNYIIRCLWLHWSEPRFYHLNCWLNNPVYWVLFIM